MCGQKEGKDWLEVNLRWDSKLASKPVLNDVDFISTLTDMTGWQDREIYFFIFIFIYFILFYFILFFFHLCNNRIKISWWRTGCSACPRESISRAPPGSHRMFSTPTSPSHVLKMAAKKMAVKSSNHANHHVDGKEHAAGDFLPGPRGHLAVVDVAVAIPFSTARNIQRTDTRCSLLTIFIQVSLLNQPLGALCMALDQSNSGSGIRYGDIQPDGGRSRTISCLETDVLSWQLSGRSTSSVED
jgi:hypothetical protein